MNATQHRYWVIPKNVVRLYVFGLKLPRNVIENTTDEFYFFLALHWRVHFPQCDNKEPNSSILCRSVYCNHCVWLRTRYIKA